ncbi:MAG: malonyl-ACP O-methyltransferase BioC [Candidatus Accumulibacter sp.]|nr:malonyl-ACP O-methyltransferase BioC [Accumulibacter sp.]
MTPMLSSSARIRASFERAAETYDDAATVQRRVCRRLLDAFSERITDPADILDAGCGTGYGARLLRARWPRARIVGADFAPSMLARARLATDACFMADIENLPLPDGVFDLWWSSLTIQWCDNAKVFAEAARTLKPGGRLVLSTLGQGTFRELREAFSGVDEYRHTLPFGDAESVEPTLESAGFHDIALFREECRAYYPDLKSLLRSIKEIGAQTVGSGARGGMMGRAAWQKLTASYEIHRGAEGLPATYDVVFCSARL